MLAAPAAIAVLLAPSLLGQRTLAGFDHVVYWHPLMTFFRSHWVADGVIPFWIPNLFAGMPLPESLGPSFFYPTDLACWWGGIPVRLFYAWDAFLHLVVAATGVYVLVRRRGGREMAAAFAACAYVLGGYVQVQLVTGTQVFIRAVGLLPWVFVVLTGEDGATRRVRPLPLGILWALFVLTQDFQVLSYLTVIVPLFLLVAPSALPAGTGPGRIALAGAVSLVIAAGLAAVVLLPASAYFRLSFRHLATGVWTQMEYLPWSQLVTLVAPDLTGEGSRAKYLGIVPVVCALGAVATDRRRAAPWVAVAGIALVLSLGPQTPPGTWLGYLPLFRSFRVSTHWILFVQLGVSVLAGAGAEAASRSRPMRRTSAGLLCSGLIGLTLADAWMPSRPHPQQLDAVEMGAEPSSALTLLAREDRGRFRIHSEESHVLLNTRVSDPLEWTTGYHGAVLEAFGRLYDAATVCGRVDEAMAVLGARYFVTKEPRSSGEIVPVRQIVGQDGAPWWLSRVDRSLPRVFVPRAVRSDPDGTLALASLCAGRLATTRLAFVAAPPSGLPVGPVSGTVVPRAGLGPNEVEAAVDLPARAVVVFDEVGYPAWKGLIDGARAPVLRANVLLRAVVVPPGHHVIRLVYDSFWFKLGLWISMVAWTGLAAGMIPARPPNPGILISTP